jgi:peptidoglycan/LPS O-acetylase OafA/YrhL
VTDESTRKRGRILGLFLEPGIGNGGRFSLYLWPYMVLVLVRQRLTQESAAVGWLVIGLSLALAIVSHLLVERPALRLGRRVVSGRQAAPEPMDTGAEKDR